MNMHQIINTPILGTIYTNQDKMTPKQKFCEYYRCSIHETDKVARYQTIFPSAVQVGSEPIYDQISQERVYNIQITEGMLEDMIQRTNQIIEESELRKSDPRLMKLYCEYLTWFNLIK